MELSVGAILEGKVKTITKFGAFVTLPENRTGMVHISEVANTYVSDIRAHLTEGQDEGHRHRRDGQDQPVYQACAGAAASGASTAPLCAAAAAKERAFDL